MTNLHGASVQLHRSREHELQASESSLNTLRYDLARSVAVFFLSAIIIVVGCC